MCGPALEALRWMLLCWTAHETSSLWATGTPRIHSVRRTESECLLRRCQCVRVGDCAFAQRVRTWPFDVCLRPWYRRYAMGFGGHYTLLSHSTAVKACRDASACAAICGDDLRGLRRHRE